MGDDIPFDDLIGMMNYLVNEEWEDYAGSDPQRRANHVYRHVLVVADRLATQGVDISGWRHEELLDLLAGEDEPEPRRPN
jgi:hypothetical protein